MLSMTTLTKRRRMSSGRSFSRSAQKKRKKDSTAVVRCSMALKVLKLKMASMYKAKLLDSKHTARQMILTNTFRSSREFYASTCSYLYHSIEVRSSSSPIPSL